MSFLGNFKGPKESEIIEKLGPQYFGITWDQLETDILYHRDAEMRNEIVSVRVDENSEPYILFSSPDMKRQRFYLLKEGYHLYGRVICINEKGETLYLEFSNL